MKRRELKRKRREHRVKERLVARRHRLHRARARELKEQERQEELERKAREVRQPVELVELVGLDKLEGKNSMSHSSISPNLNEHTGTDMGTPVSVPVLSKTFDKSLWRGNK